MWEQVVCFVRGELPLFFPNSDFNKTTEISTMLRIDKAILDTNRVICDNIDRFDDTERGLLSQNILGHIRNFVEYVAMKVFSKGTDINPNDYELNVAAIKNMQQRGDLRFLYKFHKLLQKSVSHYTLDKDASERLMLKYYEHLLKIKIFLKSAYKLEVLENIENFPLNTDMELFNYYTRIAERINTPSKASYYVRYNDCYYIQKNKPFFVNEKIYYEITFTTATTNSSKFDRVIAFTNQEIMDNYAVKLSIHSDTIHILGKDMSVLIIDEYEVSIRPCEWEKLYMIFNSKKKQYSRSIEYMELMNFLTTVKMPLNELVSSDQKYYDSIKNHITSKAKANKIYDLLDQCREIILNNKNGSNVLRYLIYKMNNRIIKYQYSKKECEELSNLYLSYGCIPFDNMPYCTSLRCHNPKIFDILNCIPFPGHEHELFGRYIKNNTETRGKLFTYKSEVEWIKDFDEMIQKYNTSLYHKHNGRSLKIYKDYVYIKDYVDDCATIIKKLQQFSSSGISQYTSSVDSWLSQESYSIDDEIKKQALRQMFENSHVALVYGSAGTGKSTLINHIANFWREKDKLFLANTHPAVDNMRRKVTAGNSEYNTIAKFLSKKNLNTECDILFIDECSTVSNNDMRQILEKAAFKLLVLTGDVCQIESIYFGNWFSIARKFVPSTSVFELTYPYRTTNKDLLTVWDRVRRLDDAILEPLVKNGYVARLDESIFEHSNDDEIILCLNYDGLYGINNINRFLQNSNQNEAFVWGINTYKIGDPVLFNESNIFSPLIHNNTKGRIVGIHPEEQQIRFDIELEESINEIDAWDYDFKLIGKSESGNSVISFSINKFQNTDEDDDDSTVIPFQIAYAVSIHKAQGLEYDSVKIVITNEVEERITHNIFYTAITRTKNKLKIYWSPETEKSILEHFEIKNLNKDANLLAEICLITMNK